MVKNHYVIGHYDGSHSPVHLDGKNLADARSSLRWQGPAWDGGIYRPDTGDRFALRKVAGNGPEKVVVSNGGFTESAWSEFLNRVWFGANGDSAK